MDRRSFIKRTAASGAAAFMGTSLLGTKVLAGIIDKEADIAVINGTDYFENTQKAVTMLGGMKNLRRWFMNRPEDAARRSSRLWR